MLHETEVYNTIQCEGLRVNSLILLKEELDVQLQKKKKKLREKIVLVGEKRSKTMDFVVKHTFFHDYLKEKFQTHIVEQSTRKTQRKNNSISSCRQRRVFDTHNFMLP